MKRTNLSNHLHGIYPAFSLALLLVVLLSSALGFSPAAAQVANAAWSAPVNLSSSGAATNPILVVDVYGVQHVVWQDQFSGYVYTQGDGTQWSPPVPMEFPWYSSLVDLQNPPRPRLVADMNGFIHAFWIDAESKLYYSRVPAKNFGSPGAWISRVKLAESAVAYDVDQDANGQLHLAFARPLETPDSPAGIYYMQQTARSVTWSLPRVLSTSPYFRSLSRETANVDVDTATTSVGEQIYVAWDNPARERVFLSRSADLGKTWEEPREVDQPNENATLAGPSKIQVSATGDNVFLLWQSDTTESSCIQYYQVSADAGATWQEPQLKPEDFLGCPTRTDLFPIDASTIVLFSIINDQVYLQAWDGTRWSDPQLQDILSSFPDAGTNRLVNFACEQPVLLDPANLLVVGCDQGEGEDVWWLKRQLVDYSDWFPKETIWNPVSNVATGPVPFLTPSLVSEENGRVHALWSQASEEDPQGPGMTIFYARWEGQQWTQPVAILTSETGKAEQPAAALDASGRLYVVWSGGQSGEVYFSSAVGSQAVLPSAWASPKLLPSPQPVGSSPDILVDPQGRLFVTFAVPLNEERGIYVVHSEDQGETWSDPIRVFDAAAAGWAMVDHPLLAMTGPQDLHIIWTRYSLPGGTGPIGLFYAHSGDGGATWSEPAFVVDKPVVWSQIVGFGGNTIHRFWQELSAGRTTLWDEASLNNGVTWARTSPVSIFGNTIGAPSVTVDRAGELHLFQMVVRGANSYVLQHWLWNGSSWATERTLTLDVGNIASIDSLVADALPDGHLVVLLGAQTVNQSNGLRANSLFSADRAFQLPEVQPTPVSEFTPTPAVVATETSLPTPTAAETTPSPTPLVLSSLPEGPGNPGNSWIGSVLVPVGAGLIVLTAVLIAIRMKRA